MYNKTFFVVIDNIKPIEAKFKLNELKVFFVSSSFILLDTSLIQSVTREHFSAMNMKSISCVLA